VVPFHGRQRAQELQALLDWCVDPDSAGIRLVVGQGNAGKTRLAAQLCRRLAEQGWPPGFVADQVPTEAIDRIRQRGEPALLVLDYAETRSNLPKLIKRAALRAGEPPMKLLLLARAAGDWWRQLPSLLPDAELLLAGVGVHELRPLAPDLDDRQAALAFCRAQVCPKASRKTGRSPSGSGL